TGKRRLTPDADRGRVRDAESRVPPSEVPEAVPAARRGARAANLCFVPNLRTIARSPTGGYPESGPVCLGTSMRRCAARGAYPRLLPFQKEERACRRRRAR